MNKKIRYLSLFLVMGLSTLIAQQEQRVGINTETPKATLDVNGNMLIRKLVPFNENNEQLTWDPNSGIVSGGYEGKTFKIYTYYVTSHSGYRLENNHDYVDFDTKIPENEYDIFLINWNAENGRDASIYPNYFYRVGVDHVEGLGYVKRPFYKPRTQHDYGKINPVPIVRTNAESGGTWHLYADWAGAKPLWGQKENSFGPILWSFEVLIAPKKLVRRETTLGEDIVLTEKPHGTFSKAPIGEAPNPMKGDEDRNIIATDKTKLGFIEGGVGKVNINIPNPTSVTAPSTLNIGGDLRVAKLNKPTQHAVPLRRDKKTGELMAERHGSQPFTAVRFEIETDKNAKNNIDKDLVHYFDTGIPKDKYYLVITSATYVLKSTKRADMGIDHETKSNLNVRKYGKHNPFQIAFASDSEDNWRIRLDYINAGPDPKRSSTTDMVWEVDVLLYSKKNFLDMYEYEDSDGNKPNDPKDFSVGGFAGGEAIAWPSGYDKGQGNPLKATREGKIEGKKLKGL